MPKFFLTALFFALAILSHSRVVAANEIYLKGNEGEKLVSLEDVECAEERAGGERVYLKLHDKAGERLRRFSRENKGTKVLAIFCGKPFSFFLKDEVGDAPLDFALPVAHLHCVRTALKKTKPCGKAGS